ncbi:unnamed protein product, partial [marine sediment metagenome]
LEAQGSVKTGVEFHLYPPFGIGDKEADQGRVGSQLLGSATAGAFSPGRLLPGN